MCINDGSLKFWIISRYWFCLGTLDISAILDIYLVWLPYILATQYNVVAVYSRYWLQNILVWFHTLNDGYPRYWFGSWGQKMAKYPEMGYLLDRVPA